MASTSSITDLALPPQWVMMEPFVSRRDDDGDGDGEALIGASGTTSWNAPFRVTFKLADPPAISRMYAHLPGFVGEPGRQLLSMLSTHQHLGLFRVGKMSDCGEHPVQDLFVFNAIDLSLKLLSHCTLPDLGDRRQPRSAATFAPPSQRIMSVGSTGLLCRGDDEFVVAETKLHIKGSRNDKVFADIFWLRSSDADCKWNCVRTRIRILNGDNTDDFRWQTYTVVPFHDWLCWIDYYNGILFGDMFDNIRPTATLVRFPPELEGHSPNPSHCWMYRSVSAIDINDVTCCLKFVKIDRHDGIPFGPLKVRDGANGFTITCHTLFFSKEDKVLEDKMWEQDYSVTSDELWSVNPLEVLPHDILMFPQVNINMPHIVYFLIIEKSINPWKKMWVVTIDMKTKKVESFDLYINGMEERGSKDADLAKFKSFGPLSFLPCGFSKFIPV